MIHPEDDLFAVQPIKPMPCTLAGLAAPGPTATERIAGDGRNNTTAMRSGRGGYLSSHAERGPRRDVTPTDRGRGSVPEPHLPPPFFNLEAAAQALTDNPHFTVVGIIGSEGTGKSVLANTLLGLVSPCSQAPSQPHSTHPPTTTHPRQQPPNFGQATPSRHAGAGEGLAFPTRGVGQLEGQRSVGINMKVSPLDRTLVIDTQPLGSAHALLALMDQRVSAPEPGTILTDLTAESRRKGSVGVPAEAVQHLQELQMATFLLASCHLLIVMVDSEHSPELWSLLQLADMLLPGLPDLALGTPSELSRGAAALGPQSQAPRSAEVVFVLAKQPEASLRLSVLEPKHVLLSSVFSGTSFASKKQGQLSILRDLEQRSPQAQQRQQQRDEGEGVQGSSGAEGCSVHLWAVPDVEEAMQLRGLAMAGSTSEPLGNAPFPVEPWQQLASRLLSHPRRPWARPLSEKEWLRGSVRIWNALQTSQELKEHLQGWMHAMCL